MSTQFKAGDRALFSGEIPGTGHRYHSPVEVQIKGVHGNYVEAVFPDRRTSWSVWVNQLTPIDQPAHKFKVGDKAWFEGKIPGVATKAYPRTEVTIMSKPFNTDYYEKRNEPTIQAKFPDSVTWDVYVAQLTPIDQPVSPQSPQPQTQKPKEDDMKRYAVIYKNMASDQSPSINSTHATDAEAKLAGEQLVAGQRQDLVKKNFFSVSILDTHTGTLIGSVVDAPPAVEWNAGK